MRGLDASQEHLASSSRWFRSTLTAAALLGFALAGSEVAAQDEPLPQEPSVLANPAAAQARSDRQGAFLALALESLVSEGTHILLSSEDVTRYRSIFEAQSRSDWGAADKALAALKDDRLVGHVLSQRYLKPNAYRAGYDELKTWLSRYSDLPEANRIHALALRHKPTGDRLAEPVAERGLLGGLPAAATMSSGNYAAWRAGLAAWKDRNYQQALSSFEHLARDEAASPWDQAAGAFWAARCLTRLGRPAEVTPLLTRAALHSRTFYGLLASRQLGIENSLNWDTPELTSAHLTALDGRPSGHRALALLQIGQFDLAEAELATLHPEGNDYLEEALVAVAAAGKLPNLALRVGTSVSAPTGDLYDAALYPMPRWQPEGGFQVDRALIFALVRQESRFEPDAVSHVGATGLMQLMPATASFISGRYFDQKNIGDLNDPELNLTLGQRYVAHLIDQPELENNLFYLLAAYNSGPTQVARWRRDMGVTNDPLLFIELIPAEETRDFVERVLANFWIYSLQMDKATPSLDATAAGDWPLYSPPEEQIVRVANLQTLN